MRRFATVVLLVALCLIGTLAIPVRVWRTGRLSVPPLVLATPDAPRISGRLWIDTDAACGYTPRTDVDDCLALWLLARSPAVDVAGISTVAGNAPLEITDRVSRELVERLTPNDEPTSLAVYRGAGDATRRDTSTPAEDALAGALAAGPLTIVALGPLTNVARALDSRPDLRRNVTRVVAVMGRQAGHLFHPSEGSGRGTFLGHGPVFRDFNFTSDPEAARALIGMDVPLTLIPYDAARHVEIAANDLDLLATRGEAGAWIAERSRGWLEYWQSDIGRAGFYPFDLMAAAYVLEPSLFQCADVRARVGIDPLLFLPLFRQAALLVDQEGAGPQDRLASYCPSVVPAFEERLRSWLGEERADPLSPIPDPRAIGNGTKGAAAALGPFAAGLRVRA